MMMLLGVKLPLFQKFGCYLYSYMGGYGDLSCVRQEKLDIDKTFDLKQISPHHVTACSGIAPQSSM